MVEMGSEKVADPPEFTTLASGLLIKNDYDKLDVNKYILLNMLIKMHSM